VIGRDNAIPWRLPEDLASFRRLTTGQTVLMGRRTWESLPARFRPLPERRNLVLSRDAGRHFNGAQAVGSVEEALAAADGEVWVIGGAAVYAAAMPYATRAVITHLRDSVVGDTLAPPLDVRFEQVADTGWRTSSGGLEYRISEYRAGPR
jgi:dihydrofolate reductase